MQTVYKLNADELNSDFLAAIKAQFPHKAIKVVIQETDESDEKTGISDAMPSSKFSPFPSKLKLSRDKMNDRRPEYLTMKVAEIEMPARDARYDL